MPGFSAEFQAHLAAGVTTLCRCWAITRSDGITFGFTDHDMPISFEGIVFKAETGLTASALAQSTGLSVDNSEAIGALSDASVSEADIEAGRFDGAEVRYWLVNWSEQSQRWLQFRGTLGELHRSGGAFSAELRGLTDALNQPLGRVYQKPCTAVLGDAQCGANVNGPDMQCEVTVSSVEDGRIFTWSDLPGYEVDWFTRGRLDVLDGPGHGMWGMIKRDVSTQSARRIELWEPLRSAVDAGTQVRLTAGCDKRMATCREKFANILNFQGFPDIPGDDWMMSIPRSSGTNSGGSLR